MGRGVAVVQTLYGMGWEVSEICGVVRARLGADVGRAGQEGGLFTRRDHDGSTERHF